MGYALAHAAAARGWAVDLVSGPVTLPIPTGVTVHRVVSAQQMLSACEPLFRESDVFIAVAAVADFRPVQTSKLKLKKKEERLSLTLEPTPDILKTLATMKTCSQTVIGFAAETHDVESYARRKLLEKNLDWIVANDVSSEGVGMNADDNAVILLSEKGERVPIGPLPKPTIAKRILDTIFGTAV